MISGLGFTEILAVGLIIILFFGSEDLPKLLRMIAQYWGKIRKFTNAARAEIDAAVKDVTPNLEEVVVDSVSQQKQDIRNEIKASIKLMSENEKLSESKQINKKLISTKEWNNAKSILIFISLKDEPQTSELIKEAFKEGKRVAVPYCKDDKGTMGIAEIKDIKSDLIKGKFNILEPKEDLRDNFFLSDLQLVITPGVAFGIDGSRLGRGKGYYDRFLKKLEGTIPIIGIGFTKQLYSSPLPFEYHDICMDKIICPDTVIEK